MYSMWAIVKIQMSESNWSQAALEDMPVCNVVHVDDLVQCKAGIAEVDELVDKVISNHGGHRCEQWEHLCVWPMT